MLTDEEVALADALKALRRAVGTMDEVASPAVRRIVAALGELGAAAGYDAP
jgi:hypothetical protein